MASVEAADLHKRSFAFNRDPGDGSGKQDADEA